MSTGEPKEWNDQFKNNGRGNFITHKNILDDFIHDYKVVVWFESNEYNEYYIRAMGFKDILERLANIIEPKVSIFKCKIEIEQL